MLSLFLFILFSISILNLNAQDRKEKKEIKRDKKEEKQEAAVNPDYVEIMPKDKILIGIHGGGIDDRFILRDNKHKNYFHLASSIVPSAGLHFKYKRLPTFSFSLPINILDTKSPFITKGYSMGLHFQPSRLFILDMYFFQINGLKLNKANGIELAQDSIYHGSKTLNLNMDMFVLFNNAKYSYKNAFLSGEIQKKSSGSFVLGLSYSFFNQTNKAVLFKPKETLYKTLNYDKIWGFSFASMFGYLHTFVIGEHFYFGSGLMYGPNFHFGKSNYNGVEKDRGYVNVSSSFKIKFASGYNSDHLLIKLIGHTGFYGYKPQKYNAFNNYLTDFRVSVTYII